MKRLIVGLFVTSSLVFAQYDPQSFSKEKRACSRDGQICASWLSEQAVPCCDGFSCVNETPLGVMNGTSVCRLKGRNPSPPKGRNPLPPKLEKLRVCSLQGQICASTRRPELAIPCCAGLKCIMYTPWFSRPVDSKCH